jgi:uncharacterized protein (TIGR02996 family)
MTAAAREQAAFLAAILAAPEDDTPRLVYADWLEEHGDEAHAEFIRVQCELARGPGCGHAYLDSPARAACPQCGRFDALRCRERELYPEWLAADDLWMATAFNPECRTFTGPPPWRWEYRRGFMDAVTCPCRDWLAHGPAVVACQPVCEVRLSDREPDRLVTGYGWSRGPAPAGHTIPDELYYRLDRPGVWPTRAAALDALSAAALAWARGERDL